MRKVIPALALALVAAVMVLQSRTALPTVTEPPPVSLAEIPRFASEPLEPTEAERRVLPADTRIERRVYRYGKGPEFVVSLVIGGTSKNSIHRPELCLPSNGLSMSDPHDAEVEGVPWRMISLAGGGVSRGIFAYTFFNQEGFRTSSHVRRIFRDVWDRSVLNRIDRWAMVTVTASVPDERMAKAFLALLGGRMGP